MLEDIRERAQAVLNDLRDMLSEARIDISIDLPPPPVPEAEPPEDGPEPLVSSDMDLIDAIEVLRARKDYSGNRAADARLQFRLQFRDSFP
jgi:signal transduction histidine kinase